MIRYIYILFLPFLLLADNNITSLSDYSFIGKGYGKLTTPSTPAPGVYKPYIPDLTNIKEEDVIYVTPNGKGDGKSESNATDITKVLKNGLKNKTIIALDGIYDDIYFKLKDINNVNIIAKNKQQAVLVSEHEMIFDFEYKDTDIYNLSFIGFESFPSEDADGMYFLFNPGTSKTSSVRNIYISDMKFHEYKVTIYSGLHSHDWTIDKTIHYDSKASYLWYMMGWHQSVINTIMYNNTYYSLSIRGSYPPDEDYIYNSNDNTRISTRSEHFLASNDWTHLIANNTFGSNYRYFRRAYGHIALYYDVDEGTGKSEDAYFPPQNIMILNNVFVDGGELKKVPMVIMASRGINEDKIDSVNGIYVKSNYTDNKDFITEGEGTDASSIDLSANHTGVNIEDFGFDDTNRDYQISYISVLKDAADKIKWTPNSDFSDHLRDDKPDVGAYEYISKQIAPKNPSNLTFSDVNQTAVTLHWKDNSDNETGFKIFRDGKLIHTTNANVVAYTDITLSPKTTYNYTVKATNDNDEEDVLKTQTLKTWDF